MRTRALWLAGVVVALLLAGVVSHYASSAPDGLTRVAQDQGISSSQRRHPAQDGPLAGYRAAGLDDGRLATGVAGVAGVLVVLLLAGGLTWGLRRGGDGPGGTRGGVGRQGRRDASAAGPGHA